MAVKTEWKNLSKAGDTFSVDGAAWYTVQNMHATNPIGIGYKDEGDAPNYIIVPQAFEKFDAVANQAYKGDFKIINTGGGGVSVQVAIHKLIDL
jgi:hypothetical protein